MADVHDPDEETLAWRVIKPGHAILDREGGSIGAVHRVLADDGADIFHGVSVRHGILGSDVEITADRIVLIAADHLHTTVAADEVASLPPTRGG
jgi:hypothetical protein